MTAEGRRSSLAGRASDLAGALRHFERFLGPIDAADLISAVRAELGNERILENFVPHGEALSRAISPRSMLHILAGNTPHGALQSLTRGLLLGSRNFVKLPSNGLPEVHEFRSVLPPSLANLVEVSDELHDSWLREAEAVAIFGSDEAVAAIRRRVPPGVILQVHGHRISFGIVYSDGDGAVSQAAHDASAFDQHGCLSPHLFYVAERNGLTARGFAASLAQELERQNVENPRRKLSVAESAAIVDLRANYEFRSASDTRTQIWSSRDSTDWTVVYEDDPWWATSPLNRFVFVKPLPENLEETIRPVQGWLGAIGIWPAELGTAEKLSLLGASRICALGRMQLPPASWHADGCANLASLVRWVDFEPLT